jgi:hypothetical protein
MRLPKERKSLKRQYRNSILVPNSLDRNISSHPRHSAKDKRRVCLHPIYQRDWLAGWRGLDARVVAISSFLDRVRCHNAYD